jgi:enediyne biosynthesis protein E4
MRRGRRVLWCAAATGALAVYFAAARSTFGTEPQALRFEPLALNFTLENGETPLKHAPETMAGGVAVFDFNKDGRPDIFFTNGAEMPLLGKSQRKYWNRLFRNDGKGRFTDVTETAGLAGSGYDTGAAVGDYDNDGFADLFVAGVHQYTLYHNNGDGTFTDVTARAGLSARDAEFGPLWGVGAAWLDYNGDGKLDLFVVNYLQWDPKTEPNCKDYCHPNYYKGTPNRLYRNEGNGRFTDVSAEAGIRAHVGKGMAAAVADYDQDGRPDIFVTNDKQENFLFHNEGNGKFRETALAAGVALPFHGEYVSGMGADFRDVDNDGLPDIFFVALQNESFPLFRNIKGRYFKEIAQSSGLATLANGLSGYAAGIYDFDNDGWKDLFVSCGHVQSMPFSSAVPIEQHNAVFRNLANSGWELLVDQAGLAAQPPRRHRGAAFGDFDGDGRMDVVVTALGAPAEIWMNRSSVANHWLDVELTGTTSTRDGAGATVAITTSVGKQYGHVSSAAGYASSSAGPVHFGLGKDDTASLVEIRWPGGQSQQLRDVKGDRVLKIQEPSR